MRRVATIKDELEKITTVEDLTQVFESIASMHIAKIRGRVVASKGFFAELWQIYSGLRVDSKKMLKHRGGISGKKGRNVLIAITTEAKFGSSSNDHVLDITRSAFGDSKTTDVMAVGTYGASWLRRHDIPVKQAFTMPSHDTDINVSQVTGMLQNYDNITVFYQTYDSLRIQRVSSINLVTTIRELGEDVGDKDTEILSASDYIFEPGAEEIADYLESVMMSVALIQVIMESKLADYANRFNNMSMAKQRAKDLVSDFKHEFYRAKRTEGDERLKEIIKVVKNYERRWAD
jgi:ATP synthase F1 gamma subunit